MLRFFANPCNIYMLLSIFYSMQGVIISTGGTIISQVVLLVIILMGLYCAINVMFLKNKPVYFKGLNLLFLLFVIYGVILLLSNHNYVIKANDLGDVVSRSSFLKGILLSLPTIYSFYYFSRKGYLTEKMLKIWILVLFGVSVFRFFDYQMAMVLLADKEEVTNNMGYLFVALIPALAYFRNKPVMQYFGIVLCMTFILLGMKRGAVLIGFVSILYFMYFNRKYIGKIPHTRLIILSLLVIGFSYSLIVYLLGNSEYFVERISQTLDGESSGRDELFQTFYSHFISETNFLNFFFGNGANATLGIGDNYAHNDWLEIAINQGVLGLVIYFYYWVCFYITIIGTRYNKTIKLALSLMFIVFFLETLFSMSYTSYNVITASVLGYSLCHYREKE